MHELLSAEIFRLVVIQRNWFHSVNPPLPGCLPEPIPASLFQGSNKQNLQNFLTKSAQEEDYLRGALEAVKELCTMATAGLSVR